MLNEDGGILIRDADAHPSTGVSTIPRLLLHSADQYRKSDAFKFKRNGQWLNVASDEFLLRVEELSFALLALGVKTGDRLAIMSENRLEWAAADYAGLSIGASIVPIYPTLAAPQVEALIRDSEPVLIFVSTAQLFEKLASIRQRLGIRYVVTFEPGPDQPGVLRLEALYEMGRQATYDHPGEFRRMACSTEPDQVATIIYTSGTTGIPKGAMLTHRNLVSNILSTSEQLPLGPADLALSFLPLSHIFQRHVDYAALYAGTTIAYAESVTSVAEDMASLRPTVAAGVPRFFEKVYARVLSEVARGPALRRVLFAQALRIGRAGLAGGRKSLAWRAADHLIFRRIRERLGGRIRFFISGGAALEREIAEFFWAIGLPIYEGYGLTETSPVIALNAPGRTRFGSVGRIVGNQEVRIAEDGEILVRGPNVMKGYYRMDRETAEALEGGWFHTGDVGELDPDGFLRITDRKKDLIVTSNGKNVAPQRIENRLKLIPYFENVVLVGDHRKFVSALITPNYEALAAYAREHGIAFETPAELIRKREIYDLAMSEIERHTLDLSDFEKIKKLAFLDRDFSIDGGELTPTLKVRRFTIEKKYRAAIDELYSSREAA
jgi:long-chain acyl-CoA synthetase